MINGQGGPKRFFVGGVVFEEEPGTLMYWPAPSVRFLQGLGAVGIGIVCLFLGCLIEWEGPLRGLFDNDNSWNRIAAGFLFVFGLLLIVAVPVYHRDAKKPFTLNRASTILRHGTRKVLDFQEATGVTILARRAGDASEMTVFSVILSGATKPTSLPLLSFSTKEEARRVADIISVLLALPIA